MLGNLQQAARVCVQDPKGTSVRQPDASRLTNLEELLLLEARRYVHADEGTIRCRGAHGPHSQLILYNAASLASTLAAMGSTYPGNEGRWRQIAVERVEHHIAQRDGKMARAKEIEAKWAADE